MSVCLKKIYITWADLDHVCLSDLCESISTQTEIERCIIGLEIETVGLALQLHNDFEKQWASNNPLSDGGIKHTLLLKETKKERHKNKGIHKYTYSVIINTNMH